MARISPTCTSLNPLRFPISMWGFQLAFNAVHCGEHCDGRDLAGAPVEIVPGEDVAEKMGFQKFVYRRRKLKEGALNFPSCEPCLVVRSEIKTFALGERPGKLSLRVLSAALFQEPHESSERVEAARESAICVNLHENLLVFVDRHPRIQPVGERSFQSVLVAFRGVSRAEGYAFFFWSKSFHSVFRLHCVKNANRGCCRNARYFFHGSPPMR